MLYLFDKNEVLIGQLKIDDLVDCYQEEIINGAVSIEFTILQNSMHKMTNVEIVAHKDSINKDSFHLYKLINSKNTANGISFEGIYTVFDDLKGYGYLQDKRPQGVEAGVALDVALQGSRWQVGTVEPTAIGTTNFYYESRLDAISKILDTWDIELSYRVTIAGNKITGRYIDIFNKRGHESHKRFVYGSNVMEVVREISTADLYTAAIGRGKGLALEDEEGEVTGGYSRKITFADVEWKKSKGDPVDKPLGQEWVEIPERTNLYGYSDGSPRFKVVDYDNIEDRLELLKATYKDLEANSRPLVTFKLTASNTGDLELGDTVGVIRKDLDIYYTTRVFKVKRDLLSNSISELEFGDNVDYSQSKKNKELKNEIKSTNNTLGQIAKETNENLNNFVKELQEEIALTYLNNDGYNYELKIGNEWNLPAGYYSFNKPIDKDPTKVIYVGAGTMLISNKKDSNGNWIWTTAANGDGFVADVINTGTLNANLIKAGILSPVYGNSFINMNTGAFNFNNDIYYDPSSSQTTIRSKLITLDGNTNVRGDFNVSGNMIVGGTIQASSIRTNTFDSERYGETHLKGNSLNVGTNSSYITISDRGGRGQVDVDGTVAAKGSNYNNELNSGGLYLSGARVQNHSSGRVYMPDGLMIGGTDLYINGSWIDNYILTVVKNAGYTK